MLRIEVDYLFDHVLVRDMVFLRLLLEESDAIPAEGKRDFDGFFLEDQIFRPRKEVVDRLGYRKGTLFFFSYSDFPSRQNPAPKILVSSLASTHPNSMITLNHKKTHIDVNISVITV
jgi:hypothetical protein